LGLAGNQNYFYDEKINDLMGRNVGAYNIRPENTETIIDISHLPTGVYVLKIGNERVKVVKR